MSSQQTGTDSSRLSGTSDLIAWFGRVPSFHDAQILDLQLNNAGTSRLRVHAWLMTDKSDAAGYIILDKHAVVTFTLDSVTVISVTDFDLRGIIYGLTFAETQDGVEVNWTSSYGVNGTLQAKRMQITLQPGKPAAR